MEKNNKQSLKRKSIIAFMLLMVLFIYALCYLIKWQFFYGEQFYMTVQNQSLWTTDLTSKRGTIYDANGEVLAQSASVWTVVLEPNNIKKSTKLERTVDQTKALIAKGLSEILDLDEADLLEKTEKNSYFVYVAKKIEEDVKNQILTFLQENEIYTGVSLIDDYKRYYPYGELASTVIGFTGTDNAGLLGIELAYEDELSGTTGKLVSMKDSLGGDMPFQYEQYIEAENGYDLVLTIDSTVQSICEKYLDEGVAKYSVEKSAVAVVMDVNTGAIKALAAADNFDLNDPFTLVNATALEEIELLPEEEKNEAYNTALYQQWRNKAVSDTYEPGSVFKMFTAAGALDSGAITENTTFDCTGSFIPYPGEKPIGCWVGKYGGSHGTQTVTDGIMNSCNPFFMQTAFAMGNQTFFDYFNAFGFTTKTGIDLPGESKGIYIDLENLGPVELATVSFGQANTVTPIQVITAASAIANGGYMVTPHVVDKMINSEGNVVETVTQDAKTQVVSKEASAIVTEALRQNTAEGSGSTGYVEGYNIAGKTGTSEKVAQQMEEYYKTGIKPPMEYIASYCGFAPADNPQYALLVYFDEPDRDIASGGAQAGPIFASIMSEILPYLGVEKDLDKTMYEDVQTETPKLLGLTIKEAMQIAKDEGLECEVYNGSSLDASEYNEEDIVKMQIPSAGYDIPVDGKVIISTLDNISTAYMTTVPDFVGKTLSECYSLANSANVQVIVYGAESSGEVLIQTQSETAGKSVKPGTVITVTAAKFSGVE